MLPKNKLDWLRIYRTKNVGPITFRRFMEKYASPQEAIKILLAKGFEMPSEDKIEEEVGKLEALGGRMIFCGDDEYPKLLKECPDRPAFLSCIGDLSLLRQDMIAIVGSRNSSIYGNKIAEDFAKSLAEKKFAVVSGMASGIDTHAHRGAKGSTVAVLGGGVDIVYPAQNADLYEELQNYGLVISEAPIGAPVSPLLFHARNRIIAGLSVGTIIVEGAKNSGSMVTIECAQSYNRDIFAVPGSPLDPRAYGPNKIIQKGAYLVTSVEDVIENLPPKTSFNKARIEREPVPVERIEGLCDKIISALSTVPILTEELYRHIGGPVGEFRAALIDLALDGKISVSSGDYVSLGACVT